MTTAPRVLFVTTNLSRRGGSPSGAAGNAWRLVFEELGTRVHGLVIAPRTDDAPDHEWIGGIEVRRVGVRRPVDSIEDAIAAGAAPRVGAMACALWASAWRAVRTKRFDLAHAMWAVPSGVACTWPRPSVPVLLSCPGSDLHRWSGRPLLGAPFRSAIRRADVVAPTAVADVARATAAGARRVSAIPVCFDPAIFRTTVCRPTDPVLASVGRLTQDKGVLVLAEAFARAASSLPSARLVVCGDGPARGDFLRRLDHHGMARRTTILGAVTPSKVAAVLGGSRMLVVASRGEGMPAAAVEALAVGRPVVTTACGDHVELVRRGAGRVVPIDDAPALGRAIVAEAHTDRDPTHLRRLVEPFRPSMIADRLASIYDDLRHRSAA